MAKGNLMQGMARGSVGDVVFSRLNGQQISRVRNRSPKNPRTPAQLVQRAIMATVMRAYSAGKEIFDHSFEGVATGAASMNEFNRRNAVMLRDSIAAEISSNVALNAQSVVAVTPRANEPIPNRYIISSGSYSQQFFTSNLDSNDYLQGIEIPSAETSETIASYAARTGLIPDDLYTFVFYIVRTDVRSIYIHGVNQPYASVPGLGRCVILRFRVKSDVLENTSAVNHLDDLFELDWNNGAIGFNNIATSILETEPGETMQPWDYNNTFAPKHAGSCGIIRSRVDTGFRSNTQMEVFKAETSPTQDPFNQYGIVSGLIAQAWEQGTATIGESELILEGGDE